MTMMLRLCMTALSAAHRRMVNTLCTSVLESCQCNDGNLTSESKTYRDLCRKVL